jgi:hypothetical protein
VDTGALRTPLVVSGCQLASTTFTGEANVTEEAREKRIFCLYKL